METSSAVEQELRFHLEMRAAELEASGLPAAEARERALREFGDYAEARLSLEREQRQVERGARRRMLLDELRQDVRHSLRMLRNNPAFAAAVLLTLAFGAGANIAMFAVVHGVLLRPLPYAEAEELVLLWENNTQEGNEPYPISPANYADFRGGNQTLTELGAINPYASYVLAGEGEAERMAGATLNSAAFRALGVNAQSGRTFTAVDDAAPEGNPVILLDGIWRRRFGADTAVIGRTITLNGAAATIVGVMPRGFRVPAVPDAEILGVFLLDAAMWQRREIHFVIGVGRLREGVTAEQARADLERIAVQLERQYPQSNSGTRATLLPMHFATVGDVQPILLVLFGAVGIVLLATCANLMNLLLARTTFRTRELAVRSALGAGRFRIVRQLVHEAAFLSVLGGALGIVVAAAALRAVQLLAPDIPRLEGVGVNAAVVGFAFVLSLLTGLLFGTLPAVRAAGDIAGGALREAGRRATASRERSRLRRGLVVVQVALAVLLVVGAGLLFRSFRELSGMDPGFTPQSAITFTVDRRGDADAIELIRFYDRLEERLAALPGVTHVGGIAELPLSEEKGPTSWLQLEGHVWPTVTSPEVNFRRVLPGYFEALSVPVIAGRGFETSDRGNQALPVLVNQTFVRRFSADREVVGRRIKLGPNPERAPWRTIIGVAGDVKNAGLASEPTPDVYLLFAQNPSPRMMLVLRSENAQAPAVADIRRMVHEIDAAVPVSGFRTMAEVVSQSIARPRFTLLLFGSFALLGLLLAVVGTYGVLSYAVARRTAELGVRMALGARRAQILALVLREGASLCVIGIALGLAGAFAFSRLLDRMLFRVSATDPVVFSSVAALLFAITLLACWLPAWRAARLDPVVSLRVD
jgi:predicted permease